MVAHKQPTPTFIRSDSMVNPLRRLRNWSGTARRMAVAFGSLLLLSAVTSWITIRALRQTQEDLVVIRLHEEAVRSALELASAVRDQYAHQAHTIIIGDESHLQFYEDAKKQVLVLTGKVRTFADEPNEFALVREIETSSGELDRIFKQKIVPAVLAGETDDIHMLHDEAQSAVTDIQERVDKLVQHFEKTIGDSERESSRLEAATLRTTFLALGAAFVLSMLIALYIGRSIAVPVAKLTEGAARLGRGELDVKIEVDTPDEFGELAHRFNAMTKALREHQEKLVQSEKLAGIGRLAAGVAHEINNPLGVILGYTRLLRKRSDEQACEDLKVIEDETLRCQQIVEGLLDLSRPLKALPERVELREVCDEVLERLGETGLASAVTLQVRGEGEVQGHSQKLRQVLFNLLKNALEAAGPGGKVQVDIAAGDGFVEARVSDSGPGIAREARQKLFEPFFTTKAQGTGLGLAVSQAIARAHGGMVVAGDGPLGGAAFTLRLPAQAVSQEVA